MEKQFTFQSSTCDKLMLCNYNFCKKTHPWDIKVANCFYYSRKKIIPVNEFECPYGVNCIYRHSKKHIIKLRKKYREDREKKRQMEFKEYCENLEKKMKKENRSKKEKTNCIIQ